MNDEKNIKNSNLYQAVTKRKKRSRAIMLILLLISLFLIILSSVFLKSSMNFKDNFINYNEKGDINYKVYLKDNDYYDEPFLDKDMQYIASLINTINVDFKYEINSSDELSYKYKYKITGDLVITEKNNPSKVLYKNTEILLEETAKEITDSSFVINEDLDINYDKYNEYVVAFQKDYSLSVDSNLVLTLAVETVGENNILVNNFNKNSNLIVSVPLSEHTISITTDLNSLNGSGIIRSTEIVKIDNVMLFVLSISLGLIGLIILISIVYLYLSKNNNNNLYEKEIKNILKNYDRLIVSSKVLDIDENKFQNKVRVTSIEELIDVYETTKQPIIYYEVIPNEKSYFIIINDDTLYNHHLRSKVEHYNSLKTALMKTRIYTK